MHTASRNTFASPVGSSSATPSPIRWKDSNRNSEISAAGTASEARIDFRAVIADRDLMSSDLLSAALKQNHQWHAAGVEPQYLIQTLEKSGADLVIICSEVSGRFGSSFDLVHQVRQTLPTATVVMLLNQSTRENIVNAFRAGVRGVFSRQQPMSELLDCIEHVRRGLIWAGREETDFLLDALKSIPAPATYATDAPALSTRELEVVKCAAEGKTNRAIAAELRLSEHTVKNYLFKAFEKLNVSNRVELLFYLTTRGHVFNAPATAATRGRKAMERTSVAS